MLLECRVNDTRNQIKRLTWVESATTGFLYYRSGRDSSAKRCMKDRALNWWSGSSNILYINSTQLTDSGNYTCSVKIKGTPVEDAKTQLFVYSEYVLNFCLLFPALSNILLINWVVLSGSFTSPINET